MGPHPRGCGVSTPLEQTIPAVHPDLAGPWVAIVNGSDLPDMQDVQDVIDSGEDITIAVVRGTAAPSPVGRRPAMGKRHELDVLVEWSDVVADFESDEHALACWRRAQAIADALNARGGAA